MLIWCIAAGATVIESTGSAPVEKEDVNAAYKRALNNAIIGAVAKCYRAMGSEKTGISQEYARFVKSYKIITRDISEYVMSVRIIADVDDIALKDADILISRPVHTAVFVFSEAELRKVIPENEQSSIINKALTEKQFSTDEQINFQYEIPDMQDKSVVEQSFAKIYSHFLFDFTFTPAFEKLQNPDNACELTVLADIYTRGEKGAKTLKIVVGSQTSNEKACLAGAMEKAVAGVAEYVKTNFSHTTAKRELVSYSITATNFANIAKVNDFIENLTHRNLITSANVTSFSPVAVIFRVESYFSSEELKNRLNAMIESGADFSVSVDAAGVVLDFTARAVTPQ